jgi:hypothetical protein
VLGFTPTLGQSRVATLLSTASFKTRVSLNKILQNTKVNVGTNFILGIYSFQLGRSWLMCMQEVLRGMILLCKAAVEVRLLFLAFDSSGGVGLSVVPDLYEKPGCY